MRRVSALVLLVLATLARAAKYAGFMEMRNNDYAGDNMDEHGGDDGILVEHREECAKICREAPKCLVFTYNTLEKTAPFKCFFKTPENDTVTFGIEGKGHNPITTFFKVLDWLDRVPMFQMDESTQYTGAGTFYDIPWGECIPKCLLEIDCVIVTVDKLGGGSGCWLRPTGVTRVPLIPQFTSYKYLGTDHAPQGIYNYTAIKGKTVTGYDLIFTRESSFANCPARCDARPNCAGFVFNPSNPTGCYLKYDMSNLEDNVKAVAFVSNTKAVPEGNLRKRDMSTETIHIPNFQTIQDGTFPGGTSLKKVVSSLSSCADSCIKRDECSFFTFKDVNSGGDGPCELFAAADAYMKLKSVPGLLTYITALDLTELGDEMSSFAAQERTLYQGNDLYGGFKEIPFNECPKKCLADEACVGFVINKRKSEGCWLKSSMLPKTKYTNRLDYTSFLIQAPFNLIKADGFSIWKGKAPNLADDFVAFAGPQSACPDACRGDDKCLGFSVDIHDPKGCKLYHSYNGLHDNQLTHFYHYIAFTADTYTVQHNVNYEGPDLEVLPDSSFRECQARCIAHENCLMFITDNAEGTGCRLKSSDKNQTRVELNDGKFTTYVGTPDITADTSAFVAQKNTGYPDFTIGSRLNISYDECPKRCFKNPLCQAFVLDKVDTKGCWLKSALNVSAVQSSTDFRTYVRKDGGVSTVTKQYQFFRNLAFPNEDLQVLPDESFDDCLSKCTKLDECRAVTLDRLNGLGCWFKGAQSLNISSSEADFKSVHDSYVKKPLALFLNARL